MTTAPRKMSMGLVTRGGVQLPPRTMIYGVDGIGKSTFGAQAPAPIFIPTEDGASRIDVPQFPLCETWGDVMGALRSLCQEPHDYKTLVLDSADWAQALAHAHVVKQYFGGDQQAFDDYGKGYKVLMQEWLKLLGALDYTRRHTGMEVILIAHAVIKTFHSPTGDDYDHYQSNLGDSQSCSVWAKTKEWCDIVLFATYAVTVRKADKKDTKGKAVQVKGEGERVCHAAPAASWTAKVRAGWMLPDKFPLCQADFRKHLNQTEKGS